MAEGGQVRGRGGKLRMRFPRVEFINPYPHMSEPEAMVHLELERRTIPFSWRYFDGESIGLSFVMPDFAPEFTLREYKTVILVIGLFWGEIPGIMDKNALATAILEGEGWKVVWFFEPDIRAGVSELFDKQLPELRQPTFRGKPRPNPYGIPDFMARRRAQLRGQGLRRAKFGTGGGTRDSARRRRRSFGSSDSGRRRRSS